MEATGLSATHALAALRAHAYATDHTTDDIAADIINGRLPPTQLQP